MLSVAQHPLDPLVTQEQVGSLTHHVGVVDLFQIGDIRGRGLFIGLELVKDRAGREPFDPGLKLHTRIKRQAMSRGLICYPGGGTIDGKRGDHVLLAPPYIIDDGQVSEIVDILGESVDAALAEVAPAGRA